MDNLESFFHSKNYNGRMLHQVQGKNQHWMLEKPLTGTQF